MGRINRPSRVGFHEGGSRGRSEKREFRGVEL